MILVFKKNIEPFSCGLLQLCEFMYAVNECLEVFWVHVRVNPVA